MKNVRFFAALDALANRAEVVIDRPSGSRHPGFPEAIYPVDYGYLAGTTSADGSGIDVFLGSDKGTGVVGAIFTVDLGKRDIEPKLLIDCSDTEIAKVELLLTDTLQLGTYLIRR